MIELEDSELVQGILKGCNQSFNEIYSRYQSKVYYRAFRIMDCPLDAEEVTQNTFVRIHTKVDTFKGESKFSSWLYRVTSNEALKLRRSNSVRGFKNLVQVPEWLEIADNRSLATIEFNHEIRAIVNKTLKELPAVQKEAFVLQVIDGFSYKEIAAMVGSNENALKQRVSRAKEELQANLSRYLKNLIENKSELQNVHSTKDLDKPRRYTHQKVSKLIKV